MDIPYYLRPVWPRGRGPDLTSFTNKTCPTFLHLFHVGIHVNLHLNKIPKMPLHISN